MVLTAAVHLPPVVDLVFLPGCQPGYDLDGTLQSAIYGLWSSILGLPAPIPTYEGLALPSPVHLCPVAVVWMGLWPRVIEGVAGCALCSDFLRWCGGLSHCVLECPAGSANPPLFAKCLLMELVRTRTCFPKHSWIGQEGEQP